MTNKRRIIYTDTREITKSNVKEVVQNALTTHLANASDMKFLERFEEGYQPLTRKKLYRKEIDVQCVDNVAHEITKFHQGYEWGNPITLIQRGEKDSGNIDETIAIAMLNELYDIEGIKTKTQQLGKDVTIFNLGYTHVDINTEWEEGESYFKLNVLNPFTTFLIRSKYYLDHRALAAVTYMEDDKHVRHFTVYTKESRFEISDSSSNVYEEMNPLGRIPIVEWIGNYDGMGIWEHEISEMNNLNLMISDFSNAVEQNEVQCIWRTNDVEFPTEQVKLEDGTTKEIVKKPNNGDWLQTYTTQDGKTPIIEPLRMENNYDSMLSNIIARRQLILEKCYVPTRSEGDNMTGVAANAMSGWDATEIVASSMQNIMEYCKMEEVKCVLAAIRLNPHIEQDSPLLDIKAKDIQPNIKRLKTYELSTKCNAFATLVSHGIDGKSAMACVNLFSDPMQVYADSKELINKYQSSIFDKDTQNGAVGGNDEKAPNADRTMQDLSDQAENSPFIGNKN